MVTTVSSAVLLDYAIHALVRRWDLSPQAASVALFGAADELGVEIDDLAALVLASEHQQRALQLPRTANEPLGPRNPALFVVGDEPAAALSEHRQAPSDGTNGWVMRKPQRLASLSQSHRPGRVGVSTPIRTPLRPGTTSRGAADPAESARVRTQDQPPHQSPPSIDWSGSDTGFSPRETEIIGLLTEGLSNQQIANRSFLSINSVKSHIRSAYRKMGVRTRTQALLWGIDHGLRPPVTQRTGE